VIYDSPGSLIALIIGYAFGGAEIARPDNAAPYQKLSRKGLFIIKHRQYCQSDQQSVASQPQSHMTCTQHLSVSV